MFKISIHSSLMAFNRRAFKVSSAKSSIFTTPTTSRNRQETPPSSPTHTPSLRIPRIQEAAVELGDSPTPSTKSELGKDPFSPSIGKHIVIEEVESPEEEEGEIPPRSPLVEEPEDFEVSEEIIMTEEVVNGFGRGRGRGGGGNNGGGRGNNGGNRDGDNSFRFPIVDEDSRATMKNISPYVLPNFAYLVPMIEKDFEVGTKVVAKDSNLVGFESS